jgi:hypothetical protein
VPETVLPVWPVPDLPEHGPHPLFGRHFPNWRKEGIKPKRTSCKLCIEAQHAIYLLHHRDEYSLAQLAELFCVARATIQNITSQSIRDPFNHQQTIIYRSNDNNDALHRESDWPASQSAQDESRDEGAQGND